jgi:copper(I)-binding protein
MQMRLQLLFLLPALILFGCRANTSNSADIAMSIELANESAAVGEETSVLVSLADSAGNPINDAQVNLRGDMNHAGMTPVLGEAASGTNGLYEIPFAFSMGGDWIITVDVTLSDGTTASETFNINGVSSEAGAEASHDMNNMSGGGISAAYFTLSNSSAEDIRLMSVSAEGVGATAIHQTIVENNIARMEEVQGGLLIPAGGTAELAPSGHHLMLMNITEPLLEGETLSLNLSFDNGLSLTVEAPISIIEPDEGGSTEGVDISVTGAWLRPSTGG